jgi:hypothetical protein
MAISLDQDFGTGGSPSAYVSGTGQTVTLTGSFAPFALTFAVPSISGKTLGTNGNDLLAVNIWTSAGSDFNARTNSLGLQTIGVDLWGVHIKVGTHTTAATDLYKQPELGPELARCQRYCIVYDSNNGNASNRIAFGMASSTTKAFCMVKHPVTMRAKPSLAVVGITVLSDTATAYTSTSTGIQTTTSDVHQTNIEVNVASGLTQYRPHFYEFGGSGYTLSLDAEL